MSKKKNKEYTTIQIDRSLAKHIKEWCNNANMIISKQTATLWMNCISASRTGSNYN